MSADERKPLRYFYGHCPYGLDTLMPEKNVVYLSLLRDPVDRIISTYYHIQQHPDHPLYESITRDGMSLEDFALSNNWPQFVNTVTRMLGADMGDFSKHNYAEYNAHFADEDDYWRARTRMNDSMIIGVQEHFHASIILFARTFKWKQYGYATKRVNTNRPLINELSSDLIIRIEKHHHYDVMLYNFAYRLFIKRCMDKNINILDYENRAQQHPELAQKQRLINLWNSRPRKPQSSNK